MCKVALLKGLLVSPFVRLWAHPWRNVGLPVLLCLAALVSVNLWAAYQFQSAQTALQNDELERAQAQVDECLRIWRYGPQTHLLAARIERAAGHYLDAERSLNECVRLQHGPTPETQLEAILLRAEMGEIRQVENGLWQCVKSGNPESLLILETLARVYLRESRLGSAKEVLDRWLEIDPGSARARHWRGWLLERLQDRDGAMLAYEKTLELAPDRWGARLRLAHLFVTLNKIGVARPHLDVLLRTHGDDPEVQVLKAQVLMREGQAEEAIATLDAVIQTHPHNSDALYVRSQLASQQNPPQNDQAEALLRRIIDEDSANTRALHALYQCLEYQGKEKQAAEALARYNQADKNKKRLILLMNDEMQRRPYDPNVCCDIGEIYFDFQYNEEGLKWLARALQLNENHPRAHEILIRYYDSKGEHHESAELHRYLQRPRAPSAGTPWGAK